MVTNVLRITCSYIARQPKNIKTNKSRHCLPSGSLHLFSCICLYILNVVSNSDQYNSRGSFLCGWTTLVRNRSCSPTSRVSSVRCEVKQRESRFIPCLFHNTCRSKTNRNIGQIEETRSHCQKELKNVNRVPWW